jgi:replicative DNA helicase
MKRIFRSIINIKKDGNPTIPLQDLEANYTSFVKSKIKPEDSFELVYHWIEAHYREYKEVPSIELLYEKAQLEGNEAVLANLREVVSQQPYTRSDYLALLKEKYDDQCNGQFQTILQNTWTTVQTGIEIKDKKRKKKIKGLQSAIEYFIGEVRKFRKETTTKIDGAIRSEEDSKEVLTEYKKRKKNLLDQRDIYTFLSRIDDVFKGIKIGDLFLIAAFVAQGKSTFLTNLIYNAIYQGRNGVFMTLEMTYAEMRDMLYVLHCSNPEWYSHPKYKHLAGKITYDMIRNGELDEKQEEFFNFACQDFHSREDFGELFILQPRDALTPSYLEMELYDKKAELAEKGKKLEFCAVDYVGLMAQDREERYGEFNVDLNNIIKKLKNLAITFDNGAGIRMISPFQVNREGWKEAVKNDGVYRLTALSNANEAERSSDEIISLYMTDDMKRAGRMKICCLKHRRGPEFQPFEANIDLTTKHLCDVIEVKGDPTSQGSLDVVDVSELVGI